jgi:hypothetical protein
VRAPSHLRPGTKREQRWRVTMFAAFWNRRRDHPLLYRLETRALEKFTATHRVPPGFSIECAL